MILRYVLIAVVVCLALVASLSLEAYGVWAAHKRGLGTLMWDDFERSNRQARLESRYTSPATHFANVSLCSGITARSKYALVSMISADGGMDLCWYVVSARKLATMFQLFVAIDMVMLLVDSNGRVTTEQRTALSRSGWQVCDVPAIDSPSGVYERNRYHRAKMFSKLHIWRLIEYDAIVFADADVVAFTSPVRLFTDIIPSMRDSGPTLAMVKRGNHWSDHNAGIMVVVPSESTFRQMIPAVHNTSWDQVYAEQDFLNVYWKEMILPLPSRYNVFSDPDIYVHMFSSLNSPIRMVFLHFASKPWDTPLRRWHGDHESMREFWLRIPPSETCGQA